MNSEFLLPKNTRWLRVRLVVFGVLVIGIAESYGQPVDTLWTRTFMPCQTTDAILAIEAFPTGGEIVAGASECDTNGNLLSCGYVQRVGTNHDTLWTLRLLNQGVRQVRDVMVGEEGHTLFIGYGFGSGDDRMETGMIDSTGNLIWINHDTTFFFVGAALCPSGPESFVSASYSLNFSQDDDILVKHHLSADSVTWSVIIGSPVREQAVDIEPLGNGYVLLGDRAYGQGPSCIVVRGLDSTGNINWTRNLSPSFQSVSGGVTVIGDTLIAVCGTFRPDSLSGRSQAYLAVLDDQGIPQSEWVSDTSETFAGAGKDCGLTPSGEIILAGRKWFDATEYDGFIAGFSLTCSLQWSLTTGGPAYDWFDALLVRDDNDIVAGGVTVRPQCWYNDDWLVGFGPTASANPPNVGLAPTVEISSCFPNPSNQGITISFLLNRPQAINLVIYDVLGRIQSSRTTNFTLGSNSVHLPLARLASGMYFVRIAGAFGVSDALPFTVLR